MKVIKEQIKTVAAVLVPQEIDDENIYRKSTFCVTATVDGASIAYNSLTGEIVELGDSEAAVLAEENIKPSEKTKELIEKWYLVPLEHDDIELSNEILAFIKLFEKNNGFRSYTIFTTMDCNARCFYCYEMGRPRIHMSAETAHGVVEFIKRTKHDGKIGLQWFGGEPLYNHGVIDIITDGLAEAGIEFVSGIVSNGYLFDDALVKKAVEKWHLKSAQITLDGTEDVYNKAKAYVNSEGKNPFKIVTDNIERLLKEKVRVSIRMNMGEHNRDDLFELAKFLARRYKDYDNIGAYAHLLFETDKNKPQPDIRMSLARDMLDLEEYCAKNGMGIPKRLPSAVRSLYCMADSPTSVTVTVRGMLGKCEHFSEDEFIGNIHDGITDLAKVEEFKERGNSKELCAGCSAYPTCVKLKKCPDLGPGVCNDASRLIEEVRLKKNLIYTYRQLKKEKEQ